MPLENATNIPELVITNPASGDGAGSTDNQIRMMKGAIKGSFPSFDGAQNVTLSETEINALPQDIADAQQAAIDAVTPDLVPLGAIVMWGGLVGSIPTGWALCDGSNGTPDLRNRFIVGAGDSYAVGESGGADSKATSSAGGHDHGGATLGHALTISQMPAHSHSLTLTKSVTADDATGGAEREILTANRNIVTDNLTPTTSISSVGSGAQHSHNLNSDGAHTHTIDVRPPYYALAYIQKVA